MTDKAWAAGVVLLSSCCGDRIQSDEEQEVRWRQYRHNLDHLTDEQWAHAANEGSGQEWIPSWSRLREWGESMPAKPRPSVALESEEAKEHARVEAMDPDQKRAYHAAGVAKVAEVLRQQGILLDRIGTQMAPAADGDVERDREAERRAELRRQAAHITEDQERLTQEETR